MARKRRAKRNPTAAKATDQNDVETTSERAVESLTEIAAASGAQAMRLAAAVARGMAKGVAGAAREMRRPVREGAAAARTAMGSLRDVAAEGIDTVAGARRAAVRRGGARRSSTAKRRSA